MNVFDLAAKLSLDSSEYESGLSKVMSSVGGMAKTLGTVVGGAIVGGTAAVTAFSKGAVSTGEDFDKAMSQVVATMGYSIEELQTEGSAAATTLETLRNFAMEMGSTTVFSATQAGEALNYMALAGYDAETSMSMLPNVLNLAAAGGMELATASDMITDAQTALGLTLEETTSMVDQMAKTASTTNTSVSQLGDAILTIGGTAQYMSGGTEELNTVLGVLANNGIKGSEAGTHLRNMLLSLSSPTDNATKLLKDLGVEVFDSEGSMKDFASIFGDLNGAMESFSDAEKLDVFSTLFNSRDTAAATALLNTTTDQWSNIKTGIIESQNAAQSMAAVQLDNLAGDITLLKSAFEGLQIVISDALTPDLREFVQFASNALSTLSTAFKDGGLDGVMKAADGIISSGISKITSKLPVFMKAGTQIITSLIKGIVKNTPAIVKAIIDTVPIIIEAVKEIGVSLADAGNELLPIFKDLIATLFNKILEEFPRYVAALVNKIPDFMSEIRNGFISSIPVIIKVVDVLASTFSEQLPIAIKSIAERLPEDLLILINVIENFVDTSFPTVFDAGVKLLSALASAIPDVVLRIIEELPLVVMAITEFLEDNVPTIIEAGINLFTSLVNDMPAIIEKIVGVIPDIITNIINTLGVLVPQIVEAGITLFIALVEALPEIISVIVEAVPEIIMAIVDALMDNLPAIVQAGFDLLVALVENLPEIIIEIVKAVVDIVLAIKNAFVEKWPEMKEQGKELFRVFSEGIIAVKDTVKSKVSEIWETVKGALPIEQALNWGKDLIDNFVNGIKSKVNKVKETVTDVADTIKGFLGFSEPEEGPLSNFHTYAPDMMELFAKGILDNEGVVTDAIGSAFEFGTVGTIDGVAGGVATGTANANLVAAIQEALEGYTIKWDDRNLGRLVRKYA